MITIFDLKKEINFYKIIWLFIVGSVLGFIVETLWCFIKNGYFQNRQGLIYGPFIPVYGIAFALCAVILYRFAHKRGSLIFLVSGILGGIFEYCCSWGQQFLTGTVSWDYTKAAFSIGGRTSIQYCVFWGVLGVFFIKEVYPLFNKFFNYFSPKKIKIITYICIILMVPNILISTLAVRREVARMNHIPATNAVDRFLDKHYPDSYLKKVFPNMIFPKSTDLNTK
ncbi:MAG: putative ABC transporter permease [Clostridium sp.]